MINCLCKESCQDRINGKNYEPNKVYEFTEERAKEVCEVENGRYFELAKGWTVTEEKDGVHVRPIENGEILDTPVEEVVKEIVEEGNEEDPETAEEIVEEATEKPKKSSKKSAK